jgi:hypothetical protein
MQNREAPAMVPGLSCFAMENPMSCTACSVIAGDSNWTVKIGDEIRGPYMFEGMAFRIAIAEAIALHRDGKRSRISIQEKDGRISGEYCLCTDFKAARNLIGS